jgi:hypothetical protein
MKALEYLALVVVGLFMWFVVGTFMAVAITAALALALAPVAVIVSILGLPAWLLYYFLL